MQKRIFADLGNLRGAAGEEIGVSDWHLVDQGLVDDFGRLTNDLQWIHVDPVRAAEGPFGGPIAHGYLLLSLLTVMGVEAFEVGGVQSAVNYGADRIRFLSPVPVGARVRSRVTLVGADDLGARGTRAVLRFLVEIEGVESPAVVADVIALMR